MNGRRFLKSTAVSTFARRRHAYPYRTGYQDIDALRSISGVHRKRMEDKRPVRIVSTDVFGEDTVFYLGTEVVQ